MRGWISRFIHTRLTHTRFTQASWKPHGALDPANRNRLLSAAGALAIWALMALLVPDPSRRAPWLYGAVLTLGYGHLLGGALVGGRLLTGLLEKAAALGPRCVSARGLSLGLLPGFCKGLALALGIVGLATLYAAYANALHHWPFLSGLLLAIATWHTAENDLALTRANRADPRLPPIARDARTQAAAWGMTALVLGLAGGALAANVGDPGGRGGAGSHAFAGILPGMEIEEALLALRAFAALAGGFLLCTPGRGEREGLGLGLIVASAVDPTWLCTRADIAFADIFALSTLYHLVSWWVLSVGKYRKRSAAPSFPAELWAVHALPVGLLGGTFLMPGDTGAALRSHFLSPAPYLFWSLGHVVQTAATRRRR
jgi:hypothetical protein